jgi:hypothetical protein
MKTIHQLFPIQYTIRNRKHMQQPVLATAQRHHQARKKSVAGLEYPTAIRQNK